METVVYILVKNGKYRCLDEDTTMKEIHGMRADGWKHTATINDAIWLECFLNGDELARARQIEDVSR